MRERELFVTIMRWSSSKYNTHVAIPSCYHVLVHPQRTDALKYLQMCKEYSHTLSRPIQLLTSDKRLMADTAEFSTSHSIWLEMCRYESRRPYACDGPNTFFAA